MDGAGGEGAGEGAGGEGGGRVVQSRAAAGGAGGA